MTEKKYQVKAEGLKNFRHRGRKGKLVKYRGLGTIFIATYSDLNKARKKFAELKKDKDVSYLYLIELDPEGGYHYRSGRQLSSGVYTSRSDSRFEYNKKILKEFKR